MATITLGSAPQTLSVVVVTDADFVASMRRTGNVSWPVGTEIKLVFKTRTTDVEWVAEINAAVASWNIDLIDVDALIAMHPRTVRLWYEEGDYQALWATGDVDVRT